MNSRKILSRLTLVGVTATLVLCCAAITDAGATDYTPGTESAKAEARSAPPCCQGGSDADCSGKHRGRNRNARGPRAGRGAQGAHHDNIHALLDNHDAIVRGVQEIDGGVETITTSEDPEVASTIRVHVRQMQQRMESGQGMRWWDPLFVELFEHHDKVRMEIKDVPGGVRVRETSDDPNVAALIRQHAYRGVSEFVAEGFARAHQPTPLPEDYPTRSKKREETASRDYPPNPCRH